MQPICLIDETFDANYTHEYRLAITLSPQQLVAIVVDTQQNKAILCLVLDANTPQGFTGTELKEVFETHNFLKHPYKQTVIGYSTNVNTLVPESFFDTAYRYSYLHTTHGLSSDQVVLCNQYQAIEAYHVYAANRDWHEYLLEQNPQANFYHAFCYPMQHGLHWSAKINQPQVFINVGHNHFYLALCKQGKLLFFNTFEYESAPDFMFYLAHCFSQHSLSQQHTPLHLCGNIQKNDPKYQLMQQYFSQVYFQSLPDHFNYSYLFNKVPVQLCVASVGLLTL